MAKLTTELKVGIFAAAALGIIVWATIRVSDKTTVYGGGYLVHTVFENATGLKFKAPVELAGVKVGVVKNVELRKSREALVTLLLSDEVNLTKDCTAVLRTRGFLGESYVEIVPGSSDSPVIVSGEHIENSMRTGDINTLVGQFGEIASDIKQITKTLRETVGEGKDSPVGRIVNNLEDFTKAIKDLTVQNEGNINRVTENLAEMTTELRELVSRGESDVRESMERIASITRKIDEGKGTVGRLVNDEETVEKLNEAVDGLNETLGGFKRIETEIGFHTEYMTKSEDFKNYVSLALKPAPDKAFLIDVVSDPNPNPSHMISTSDITVGGATTRVSMDTATVDRSKLRFSAQLAKKFYDFTLRGGIIESTGGFGLDYEQGPMGVQFSAFDFSTRYEQLPHLKLLGNLNLTRNFYLVGGADDFIARRTPVDWFIGGGFRLVDDDIKTIGGTAKSLIGK